MPYLLVGIGGAAGSVLRYALAVAFAGASFPYATLIVNVLGCFCIGLALPGFDRAPILSAEMRLLLVVGFLGGFTTFSTFGHETASLLQMNAWRAVMHITASLTGGVAAVFAGRAIARWMAG